MEISGHSLKASKNNRRVGMRGCGDCSGFEWPENPVCLALQFKRRVGMCFSIFAIENFYTNKWKRHRPKSCGPTGLWYYSQWECQIKQ